LAYKYLERYLYQDPPLKEQIDAMYYLSLVSPTEAEQRDWIEKILTMDPTEGRARRQLAILNGELQSEKIVDPDTNSVPDIYKPIASHQLWQKQYHVPINLLNGSCS
jgi:hypothetical protein